MKKLKLSAHDQNFSHEGKGDNTHNKGLTMYIEVAVQSLTYNATDVYPLP